MKRMDLYRFGRMTALLGALMLAGGACQEAGDPTGKGPAPARRGLAADGQMQISKEDRCPVCAMPVLEHRHFSAAIVLEDQSAFYFCTPGCMLRAWLQPARYLNRSPGQLSRPVVRDYFTGDCIDARQALWVCGSDVIGPMGPALVALTSEQELAAFRRRHGAGRIFRLSSLSAENWEEMTGTPPGR